MVSRLRTSPFESSFLFALVVQVGLDFLTAEDGLKTLETLDLAQFATLVQGLSPSTPNTVDGYLKRLGSVTIGAGKIGGSEHVRVAVTGN